MTKFDLTNKHLWPKYFVKETLNIELNTSARLHTEQLPAPKTAPIRVFQSHKSFLLFIMQKALIFTIAFLYFNTQKRKFNDAFPQLSSVTGNLLNFFPISPDSHLLYSCRLTPGFQSPPTKDREQTVKYPMSLFFNSFFFSLGRPPPMNKHGGMDSPAILKTFSYSKISKTKKTSQPEKRLSFYLISVLK